MRQERGGPRSIFEAFVDFSKWPCNRTLPSACWEQPKKWYRHDLRTHDTAQIIIIICGGTHLTRKSTVFLIVSTTNQLSLRLPISCVWVIETTNQKSVRTTWLCVPYSKKEIKEDQKETRHYTWKMLGSEYQKWCHHRWRDASHLTSNRRLWHGHVRRWESSRKKNTRNIPHPYYTRTPPRPPQDQEQAMTCEMIPNFAKQHGPKKSVPSEHKSGSALNIPFHLFLWNFLQYQVLLSKTKRTSQISVPWAHFGNFLQTLPCKLWANTFSWVALWNRLLTVWKCLRCEPKHLSEAKWLVELWLQKCHSLGHSVKCCKPATQPNCHANFKSKLVTCAKRLFAEFAFCTSWKRKDTCEQCCSIGSEWLLSNLSNATSQQLASAAEHCAWSSITKEWAFGNFFAQFPGFVCLIAKQSLLNSQHLLKPVSSVSGLQANKICDFVSKEMNAHPFHIANFHSTQSDALRWVG